MTAIAIAFAALTISLGLSGICSCLRDIKKELESIRKAKEK